MTSSTVTLAPSTAARYRMIGTTDDVVECAKCGKVDLRATYVLELLDAEGNVEEVTYFGSTCAGRALAARGVKRTAAQLRNEASSADRRRETAARHSLELLDFYQIPAEGDLDDDQLERAAWAYQANNPSLDGLRPLDWARDAVVDAIARWRAAVAA